MLADDLDGLDPTKQLKAERKAWADERREIQAETDRLRALLDLTKRVSDSRGRRIVWSGGGGRKRAGRSRAVVTTILSDLHLDETVRPEEMHHVNSYDRRIAQMRLGRWVEKACSLPREHMAGVDYDGAALFLAGDLLSGDIHEELRKTNADTIAGGIAYWIDPLSKAVRALADTYGKVTVDVVAGNHGRNPLNRRSPAKGRARDNFDTLIGWLIARDFADDPRVEVHVEESTDAYRQIYNHRYLVNHGDSAKGGSGIAGALSPLMLFSHRKGKVTSATGQPYDTMVVGHWHQLMMLPGQGLIVNGSLKGYDEYARVSGFSFEPPQQGLWLTTPEHGITVTMPVLVQDRKAERW